ncbi:MAG: Phosphoheptose isomerase [Gammaproteobacteria bacterium]|jgi:D-sedoheptulose 7-phosphate isomerase|nr:Phosphoheptose isomerase [Gammaproteobacteria bacterium]
MKKFVISELEKTALLFSNLLQDAHIHDQLASAVSMIVRCMHAGGKVLLAGNGGSAADAQHIAGEFVSRFYYDRPGLPAFALTVDSSVLTAIGNDYGYEYLFARQVEACGKAGDVFVGISTSGNSPNILSAFNAAREKGIATIGLSGESGGKMRDLCDLCICIPSKETPKIQEGHIVVSHIICALVEREMFPRQEKSNG